MKKKVFFFVVGIWMVGAAHAEGHKGKWWQDIKQNTTIGGLVVGKAAFNDQELDDKNESHSTFDIRMVRAFINGKIGDFKYGFQMEMTGVAGSSAEKGPRVLDAWAEWCKYTFLTVKLGQFKRCFTFENPMKPWDIGFGGYSQVTMSLVGMNDRAGEHTSGGRDLGLQLQGDLLKSPKDGHGWLHYQIGVYNGQGINHTDRNDNKDIIGGGWISPVKDLCIGITGWTGEYSKDVNGKKITVDRNRMAFGVKYESGWTVRGEYVTGQGHKVSDYSVADDGTVSVGGKDKADGWYATVGVPVTRRCKIYGKWDVYRDRKDNESKKSVYNVSVNYTIFKNLKIQGLYGFVEDKAYNGDRHYNTADVQLYWRF